MKKFDEIKFQATPVSPGIAIGKLAIFRERKEHLLPKVSFVKNSIEHEIKRFREALAGAASEIRELQSTLANQNAHDRAKFLEAHLEIIQDPFFQESTEELILQEKKNAAEALKTHFTFLQKRFQSSPEFHLSERFSEVRDVAEKVLGILLEDSFSPMSFIPKASILAIRELTPLIALQANKDNVLGFISETGTPLTHAAIITKARKIPYITGIPLSLLSELENEDVIIEGYNGMLTVSPKKETQKRYKSLLKKKIKSDNTIPHLKAETFDGHKIKVSANISDAKELEAFSGKVSGIGLFRSEYVVLPKNAFPSEEEQFEIYKNMLEKFPHFPVIIRTFDLKGDKSVSQRAFGSQDETLQKTSCTLQFFLQEKELFKTQIRALLRASIYGQLGVMFPMVTTLSDLREAKKLFQEATSELSQKKIPISKSIRIGAMIEVPSAAIIADLIASECDFLSIGTNDLVQYSLASESQDRKSHPAHPSIIRLIRWIVSEANHKGVPVTVCGEMASDPRMTPLLIGLGIHELSCSPGQIDDVVKSIRSCSIIEASTLAKKALLASTSEEIESLLHPLC